MSSMPLFVAVEKTPSGGTNVLGIFMTEEKAKACAKKEALFSLCGYPVGAGVTVKPAEEGWVIDEGQGEDGKWD